MSTIQKSLRIPEEIIEEVKDLVLRSGKDFTALVNELLEEAIKAHHCPGIIFVEGTSGKRARISGTGIEVWEIIATYKSVGEDVIRLKKTYHWLAERQLKSAIAYYSLYKGEIDALIAENEGWTTEEIRKKYPILVTGKR